MSAVRLGESAKRVFIFGFPPFNFLVVGRGRRVSGASLQSATEILVCMPMGREDEHAVLFIF